MEILVSLKENTPVKLKQEINNWEEAINQLFEP